MLMALAMPTNTSREGAEHAMSNSVYRASTPAATPLDDVTPAACFMAERPGDFLGEAAPVPESRFELVEDGGDALEDGDAGAACGFGLGVALLA